MMKLTWDESKRRKTLQERGLDFADCEIVFAGPTYTFLDRRKAYGEDRFISVGLLSGRMLVIVYTPRDGGLHIISMRKANDREQKTYKDRLG